jgi:beta-lactamase regulating signal transducer with metallopeptidase domain
MMHLNFAMTTLLNGTWEGALLAVTMGVFLKLLSRLNSTTRFTVLWLTLLAVVALLVGPFTWKAFISDALASSPAAAMTTASAQTILGPVNLQEHQSSSQDSDMSLEPHPASVPRSAPRPISERPLESVEVHSDASGPLPIAIASAEHPLIRIHSGRVLRTLGMVWALLSLLMLVRLGLAYRNLRGLKAEADLAPAEWRLRLRTLMQINGVSRQTELLVSSRIAVPVSLGFVNPAILIPRPFFDTLSNSELEHLVLHELGHLQRRDDWTNLAEKLIEAMLPIQPAVYWIGRRISIEREMACDDWVIAATGTAEPYAASLAKVAELSQWTHAGVLAAGATGNRSQLFLRVRHMLDRSRNAAPKLAVGPLGAAIAAIGILICVGVRAPQMIAFAQTSTADSDTLRVVAQSPTQTPRAPRAPVAGVSLNPEATQTPSVTVVSAPTAEPATSPAEPSPVLLASGASPLLLEPATALAETQQDRGNHVEMRTRNGWSSLTVKIDGAVEFTDDDHDVKSLSPGGRFRVEEGTLLSGRTYEVKADSSGNLTKTYSVGSSVRSLDADGRAWLNGLLPQMIRDSGIGAEARVARILRQGGPPAVLSEIRLIHSDGSKRTYLEQLFAQAPLNTEQMRAAAALIRGISSDGDKAQVLIDEDGRYFTHELRPEFFEAVESISSDGDKRRVLSDILKKDAASAETLFSVARVAKHISSDGDKAEVLIEMASSYRENDGIGMAYFEAVKSISSDGDHARVLLAILASHGNERDTLARVLGSAEKISSDGDKARVLKEAVGRYSEDAVLSKAFFAAADSISSDGDHQQVLVALAHRPGIGAATVNEIAKSAQRISSDGDKARVLVELVAVNVEPSRDSFFEAVDSLHSDGDHGHVLMTLLDKPGTSSTMAIAAIQSATHISSDGDMGNVLMDAAHRYSKDPKVDAALRKAVESLHSDSQYRSVMSSLARGDEGN